MLVIIAYALDDTKARQAASASNPELPTIVEISQCPKPIGVYQNENAVDGTGPGLAYYFTSPNIRTDPKLGIVRADRSVLDLLIEDDRRGQSHYAQSKGERLTLELRPLTTPARFKVVVRSSLGRTGEGEAGLDLSRSVDNSTGNRCHDGTVRGIYSKTGKVNVAWWVDRDTGDIVGARAIARMPMSWTAEIVVYDQSVARGLFTAS